MKLTNIFVVADRDDPQQLALRAALDLVRGSNAVIHLVGFVHDAAAEQAKLMSATTARRLKAALVKDRETWLDAAAARHTAVGVTIQTQAVWAKDINAWVNEHVTLQEYGLLVKAGHRSENFVYTPTDWRLFRECKVPVLIARERLRRKPARVMAAVDLGSDQSVQRALNKRVLDCAALIAQQIGAELHIISAIPVSVLAQDLDLIDGRALEARVRRKLASETAALAAQYGLPPNHIKLRAGPPERVIDGAASKLKAALVVMGTIGRKGLKGKLLGNTAEKVLHGNRSNVLALRPDN